MVGKHTQDCYSLRCPCEGKKKKPSEGQRDLEERAGALGAARCLLHILGGRKKGGEKEEERKRKREIEGKRERKRRVHERKEGQEKGKKKYKHKLVSQQTWVQISPLPLPSFVI